MVSFRVDGRKLVENVDFADLYIAEMRNVGAAVDGLGLAIADLRRKSEVHIRVVGRLARYLATIFGPSPWVGPARGPRRRKHPVLRRRRHRL